jgi:uncharacterized protein (DUF934 family)
MPKTPRKIIKNRMIIDDTWTTLTPEKVDPETLATTPSIADKTIVPLALWQENKVLIRRFASQKNHRLGLALSGFDEPNQFADDLELFEIITINFPTFTDGRGYSLARLLRERYQYQGEIRAVGDVLRDQLFYMQRCGFNAFEIREDRCIKDALKAYNDFSITYQSASDNTQPIYRQSLS